jgi:hypothetical protein
MDRKFFLAPATVWPDWTKAHITHMEISTPSAGNSVSRLEQKLPLTNATAAASPIRHDPRSHPEDAKILPGFRPTDRLNPQKRNYQ